MDFSTTMIMINIGLQIILVSMHSCSLFIRGRRQVENTQELEAFSVRSADSIVRVNKSTSISYVEESGSVESSSDEASKMDIHFRNESVF